MPAARLWFNQRRKAADPFGFFSYGMTKCGSTLAFQLARVALIQAGFEQPLIPFPNRVAARKINFTGMFDEAHVAVLRETIADLGHPVVIKTHNRPDLPLVRLVEDGEVRAHAVFRDPRDMALSLLDSGRENRARGRPAFTEFETLSDTHGGIRNQLDSLTAWLQMPGVRRLPYDRVAFETETAAAEILEHLGIDGEPRKIVRQVLRREFIQRNKAVRDRHKTEMSAEDQAAFGKLFAPFYRLVADAPDATDPLPPNTQLYAAVDTPAASL
ncbi:MAG: sulfotransferase domain-containing protein [Pseudomonadota bacterium]